MWNTIFFMIVAAGFSVVSIVFANDVASVAFTIIVIVVMWTSSALVQSERLQQYYRAAHQQDIRICIDPWTLTPYAIYAGQKIKLDYNSEKEILTLPGHKARVNENLLRVLVDNFN